ncbi:cytochrome c biogenesis protein DipZ [Acidocella aromatica]|uniref:Cytochrome c biogenesis protein CcdA/thiol-disulfide isomerase/thioredoxin n=1 Tax=Acidocella aromatica TaxID=1303579 RepID=A0A840VAV6_9PROT|nr:cytochrome c biogenesis protein CcdA [Acidocella aromatica]MBB5373048.1 cytochrome c biogenesis protein CcdA/thiol-disulfide isomerase/thioredoxin [Acidocella aromatica]
MLSLLLVTYLGGVLTILSPCILPVLPFVFARAGRPFTVSTLPLLAGMAITFAGLASVAALGGAWIVRTNEYGRNIALALFALLGLSLLFPSLADRMTRPLVALGNKLSAAAQTQRHETLGAGLLGVAVGFLWAPCAGPILGLVLAGSALTGASLRTGFLLLAYAAGAATSLGLAVGVGGGLFKQMKRELHLGEWVRRGAGVVVLLAVAGIASGAETGVLARLSSANTTALEQGLLRLFGAKPSGSAPMLASVAQADQMPPLTGATAWLNSPTLAPADLRGKVVLIDFWTYSCINCLRTLPYVTAWNAKYKDHGLVIIGVHSPEFAFERDTANVAAAVKRLGITYPVAVDSNLAIWNAFANQYWPAEYLVNAQGEVVSSHFGEGDYAATEMEIQQQLRLAGYADVPGGVVTPGGSGAEAAADMADDNSPETYIGYARAENFASPQGMADDQPASYTIPARLGLNQWALGGTWQDGAQAARLVSAPGSIAFHFQARDLHLVLGPGKPGETIRFRVLLDGAAPGADHGADTDAQGYGVVDGERLYQLVRQSGTVRDRVFTIQFLDPDVDAYSFTFG